MPAFQLPLKKSTQWFCWMLEFQDALNLFYFSWASEVDGCFFPQPATHTLVEVKIAMLGALKKD